MKLPADQIQSAECRVRSFNRVAASSHRLPRLRSTASVSGFTMIEIALCLAIIGFALVSILLVLPLGMNTQRDNRQLTIINQDASMLMETMRNGSYGSDDLTNYVYAITNYWTYFDRFGKPATANPNINGYSYSGASVKASAVFGSGGPYSAAPLTNGFNIVGLMSTPEFIADTNVVFVFGDTNYYPAVPDPLYAPVHYGCGFYSNHVVAYVRSMSGLAVEKPPQDNQILQENSFTYRVACINAPIAVDTNMYFLPQAQRNYQEQLAFSLRELRMLFMWPQLPGNNLGPNRQTFRTSIAGQLQLTNVFPNIYPLYFYEPATFVTNTP